MARERFYWDANAFIGYLNEEPGKVDDCHIVLKAAEAGKLVIVTSALTLAEVLWIKGQPKLDPAKRQRIELFFKAPYISVQNVTRALADAARDVVWDYNIKPKDAIHVATTCLCQPVSMHTYDGDLLALDGQKIGGVQVSVCKPKIPHQADWIDATKG